MRGIFNNRLLFPLLFSRNLCRGKGLDGGRQSCYRGIPHSPTRETLQRTILYLRMSTGLGFLESASLKDDQFNLLVWLLLSLLALFSKALNFVRACN